MAIPSKEYWAERAIQREQESAVYGARASAKLFQEYQQAAREIQKEIGAFYAKYGNKYGLSYEDAVRLLTRPEFRDWKGTLADYMEKIAQEPDPRVKALLTAQLDALSANSQISRLEALQGQIDLILGDLYDHGVQQLRDEFGAEIIESYYKKSFDIQSRAGFYNEIAKIDVGTIEDIVTYPWSGANFSDRLWRNTSALIFKSREILTQGLIQGKSIAAMSKQLSDQMGQSFRAAHRLIITETTHFHNAADLRAYEENGTEWYEFVANNDEKTCEVCGALAGKRFRRKDAVEGTNFPVMHPNCHCTTTPVFPDIEEILTEAGRDPRTRRDGYSEWYADQTAKNGQGSVEIERKKWYNKAADQEQFDAYLDRLGADAPDDFDAFQSLKYQKPDEWKELKSFYSYKGRVPEATKGDFGLWKDVRATGITGTIRVPPAKVSQDFLDGLAFRDAHGARHGVTLADAKKYVQDAKFTVTRRRWDGKKTNYYSTAGATYIDAEGRINTAFGRADFDETAEKAIGVFEK